MRPIAHAWTLQSPLELVTNTTPTRTGRGDPTGFVRDDRVWRASRHASGSAVIALWVTGSCLHAEAWGAGADEALDGVPALVGITDNASGFEPHHHPFVADAARAHQNVRLGRTNSMFDAAVRAVLAQKVTGLQATRSYNALVRRCAEPAPLPRVSRRPLFLPPTPRAVLGALAGHGATTLGVDATRAATLREVALVAYHLAELDATPPANAAVARAFLQEIPGVGEWTANEVTFVALGDHDAVSVGDFHLKNLVSYALTTAPRGTDERMIELLEPFRPHRARVVRLIELSGARPPRDGPRMGIPAHVPTARP